MLAGGSGFCGVLWAADKLPPLDLAYQAEKKIIVPTRETPQALVLTLPAWKKKPAQVLCLKFQARHALPVPGGWSHNLSVKLNGQDLGKYTLAGEERLLRRGVSCQTTIGKIPWWDVRNGKPALLTFYGPGGEALDQRVVEPKSEGYWYLLDVSDAAHYLEIGADERIESAKPNSFTLVNAFIKRYRTDPATPVPDLVIEDLVVGYLPTEIVEKSRPLLTRAFKDQVGPELRGRDYVLAVGPQGGMQIKIGKDDYFFESHFSYPGEKSLGHNVLAAAERQGEASWNPAVKTIGKQAVEVQAEGRSYTLTRTVTLLSGKIRVADRIQNKRDVPIGLLIKNTVFTRQPVGVKSCFLAGMEGADVMAGVAENPSLFVTQKGSGLGLLAEDNVFRLQLELARAGSNAFTLGTSHFGLDRNKEYTLEWTIYPSQSRDYFDFINQARRDWDVNFTVLGPFVFGAGPVPGRKAAIYTFGPWFEYFDEIGMTREGYLKAVQGDLAHLKAREPRGIVMGKIETNLVGVDKRKIKDGNILPRANEGSRTGRQGTYGLTLTTEQTRVLSGTLLEDSLLKEADGRLIVDTYYATEPFLNFLVYVEEGNRRYKTFLNQIDFFMDEVGFNGVYIDQFSLGWGTLARRDRCTYEKWDGHTVDLDERGGIKRKYTDCSLVGASGRAKIIKRILSKGGKVVINGFPVVRETQSLPAFRFAEMENDPVNPLQYMDDKPPAFTYEAKGHLASPIILGIRPGRFGAEGKARHAEIMIKAVITALRNGLLYYYYDSRIPSSGPGAGDYGPVNHMFPFTPRELHAGWLVGKERILTCISGTFFWDHPQPPTCLLFDRTGREKKHNFTVTQREGGWNIAVKLRDWNEIAVLE
jgi:hypothetical protein